MTKYVERQTEAKIYEYSPAKYAKDVPEARRFIEDLIEVFKKHGFSLGHEDYMGGFIVENYSESNLEWLRGAHFERE